MSAVTIVCHPEAGRLARALRAASDVIRPVPLSGTGAVDAYLGEAAERYPDAVVVGGEIPGVDTHDLLRRVREQWPDAACFRYDGWSADEGTPAVVHEFVPTTTDVAGLAARVSFAVRNRTHVGYPLPDAESERLAALGAYDHERLVAERPLDGLARDVTEALDVDHAFASVLDAHSMHLVGGHDATGLPVHRQDSVCTHTILASGPFVVEDTAADPWFGSIDALRDAPVRSYAGVPLLAPSGEAIGTLCGYDAAPRSFGEGRLDRLVRLAARAEDELLAYRYEVGATTSRAGPT